MHSEPAIVLFDGECAFCDASVRFIIARDPAGRFRFAAQASEVGRRLLVDAGLPPTVQNSLVLIDAGRAYTRSAAALRIARRLTFPWPLAAALLWIVPPALRDAAYGWFARRRYGWFGRLPACRRDEADRGRFLD